MYDREKNEEECRIQKVGDKMTTLKLVREVKVAKMIKNFL